MFNFANEIKNLIPAENTEFLKDALSNPKEQKETIRKINSERLPHREDISWNEMIDKVRKET